MATRTTPPSWVSLTRPQSGQHEAINANPQATGITLDFPADAASLERSGDNLIFAFADGASFTVLNFYGTYSQKNVPDFNVDGVMLAGTDFLSGFGEGMAPAAGPAALQTGGRFSDENTLDVLGGINALDGLDPGASPAAPIPTTVPQPSAFVADAGGAAPQYAATGGSTVNTVVDTPPTVPSTPDDQPTIQPMPLPPTGGNPPIPDDGNNVPPVQPEVPPVQPEVPPVQPEVPPVQPEVPPVQPEVPPVQPEVPPVQPEVPPVQPEVPPVQPEIPPVQPEVPPVQPEVPPVQPPVQPPVEPGMIKNLENLTGGQMTYVTYDEYGRPVYSYEYGTTISGTGGNDTITVGGSIIGAPTSGGMSGGIINAGAGDDIINVTNLSGHTLSADPSGAGVLGGAGNDTINIGSMSGGTVSGGEGDDTITVGKMVGGQVQGDAGNDHIRVDNFVGGGDSNATILGGEGDDVIGIGTLGGAGEEGRHRLIDGGSGDNTFILDDSRGHEITLGNDNSVTIDGGDLYTNTIIKNFNSLGGGSGNDTLRGNDGDNTLYGGAGDDMLYGGRGNNVLIGGEGSDTFVWTNDDIGGFTNIIKDFEVGKDKIQLDIDKDLFQISGSIDGSQGQINITDQAGNTVQTIVLEGVSDQADIDRVVNDINANTTS